MEKHRLCFSRHSHLKDHILFEEVVISAATVIIETSKLLSNVLDIDVVTLTDVFFLEAIIIRGSEVSVTIIIEKKLKRFEILTPEGKTAVVGKFLFSIDHRYSSQRYSHHRRDSVIDKYEFYRDLHNFGYEHSGVFQSVQKVVYFNNDGVADLIGDYIDAVFDGLLQVVVLKKLLETPHGHNEITVPFSFKEVVISLGSEVISGNTFQGSFHDDTMILTSSGQPLLEVKGVVFKRILRPVTTQKLTPIVIRSAACRLPGGIRSLADFANFFNENQTADTKIPAQRIPDRNTHASGTFGKPLEGANFLQDNIAAFDPAFFGINKLEAKAMDPQQRLLLEVTWECFENAGITDFQDCGFYVGQMGTEYSDVPGGGLPNALGMVGEANSVLAGRLNFFFGSYGPSESIDTACSSSLVALQNAVDAIQLGRCKRAVVAGTSLILSSHGLAQRISGNLLSKDGICHSFDIDADGYGRGEGIVAILIEAESDDTPKHLAKIDSIITNHGGRSAALTAPNGAAHFLLIEKAITASRHSQINYWECHGTGTSLGDPIELSALQKVLTKLNFKSKVIIGTSKANLGHCEGTAGLVGILKAIVVLQSQYVTRLPRFRLLNKNIKTDANVFGIPIIGEELCQSTTLTAGISSFGVSGTNVAVVISSPDTKSSKIKQAQVLGLLEKQGIAVLPFSAKNPASLDALTDAYSNLCFTISNKDFTLLAAAAALSRKPFKLRGVFIRTRTGELSQIVAAKAPSICFKVDCTPPVAWNLIYRVPEFHKAFFDKLKVLIDPTKKTRRTQVIRSLKMADIWAKWSYLHSLGIHFDHLIADDEEEAYFAEELTQVFHTEADVIPSNKVNPGSLVFGSTAYPIQDPVNVNHILAAAYLQAQDIHWSKVYALTDSEANILPYHDLPNYAFDRQLYWSKKVNDDFDHKLLGNIIFETPSEIRLENWVLKQRLQELFSKLSLKVPEVEMVLLLELLMTVSKAVVKNIGFEIRELEVLQPLQTALIVDNIWVKTIIEIREFDEVSNVTATVVSHSPTIKDSTIVKFKFMLIPSRNDPEEKAPQLFQDWTLDLETTFEAIEAHPELTASNIKHTRVLKGKDSQSLTPNVLEKKVFLEMRGDWRVDVVYQKEDSPKKSFEAEGAIIRPKLEREMAAISHPNFESFEEIKTKILEAVKEVLDAEIAFPDEELVTRGFIDLGIDSLSLISLLNELNSKLFKGVELTTTDLFTYTNVEALAENIFERLQESRADSSSSSLSPSDNHSTTSAVSISDSTPPNSPNINFFKPSSLHAYEIIPFVPELLEASRIIIHFNDQTNLAEAQFDSTVIQLSTPSSFSTFLEKLRLLALPEYSVVFRFDPLPPRPSMIQSETIQFLLTLATTLAKLRKKLCFTVIENENPLSGLFSGFWKSFVVEKMTMARFNFAEKVRPLGFGGMETKAELNNPVPHGTWLITGGTNGIGLVMARHLASFSTVSQVYVLSRQGKLPKSYHKLKPVKIDVTRFDQIQNLFCTLDAIDGIIHSAGVVSDAIVERQTLQSFEKVISPKVDGLKNIIKSLKYFEFKPKFLILNSSVSSLFGNFGQTNYSGANAAAEKLLTAYRNQTGIGSIVHWGNWLETGMAADETVNQLLIANGFVGLSNEEGLAGLDLVIEKNFDRIMIAKMEWPKVFKTRKDLTGVMIFSRRESQSLFGSRDEANVEKPAEPRDSKNASNRGETSNQKVASRTETQKLETTKNFLEASEGSNDSDPEPLNNKRTGIYKASPSKPRPGSIAESIIEAAILAQISEILHLSEDDVDNFDTSMGFMELGLDSLKLYMLAQNLSKKLGFLLQTPLPINVIDIFENPSPKELTKFIAARITSKSEPSLGLSNGIPGSPNKRLVFQRSKSSQKTDSTELDDEGLPGSIAPRLRVKPTALDAAVIAHHQIGQKIIVPAAFEIDYFLKIISEEASESSIVQISQTHLNQATEFKEVPNLSLQITEDQIMLHSAINVAPSKPKTTCYYSFLSPSEAIPLVAFSSFKLALLEAQHFYRTMAKRSVNYGPKLQLLNQIRRSSSKLTCRLASELTQVQPKWLLFEAGLQALAAIIFDRNPHQYFVPIKIDKIIVKNRYLHDDFIETTEIKIESEIAFENQKFIEGNVAIFGEMKDLIAEMRGVTAVKMDTIESMDRNGPATKKSIVETVAKRYRRNAWSPDWTAQRGFRSPSGSSSSEGGAKPNGQGAPRSVKEKFKEARKLSAPPKVFVLPSGGKSEKKFPPEVHKQYVASNNLGNKTLPINSGNPKILPERTFKRTATFIPNMKPPVIEILGYACEFPNPASDVQSFWYHLTSPTTTPLSSNSTPQPLLLASDPAFFRPEDFNITPKEAPFVDPQQRLLLQCTKAALKNASISKMPPNTGVFIGQSSNDFENACNTEFQKISEKFQASRSYLTTGTNSSCLAGRLAHWLKAEGPSIVFDTACSSFATALSSACDYLTQGSIDYAIVGAVNYILNKKTTDLLLEAGMLSPNQRCAVFSPEADGYVRAEGVAVVILSRTSISTGKIQIVGWDVRHNGNSAALTVPYSASQVETLKNALAKAGNPPVDLIECHGSGTKLGDPIEVQSILNVLSPKIGASDRLIMTGMKAHVGHAEACAAGVSLIAVCEMMKRGYIPGQRHFEVMNGKIRALQGCKKLMIPTIGMEKKIQTAAINSFGFSGTNVSVILKAGEGSNDKDKTCTPSKLILIGAKTEKALGTMVAMIEQRLKTKSWKFANLSSTTLIQPGPFRASILLDPSNPTMFNLKSSTFTNAKHPQCFTFIFSNFTYPTIILKELYQNHALFKSTCRKFSTALSSFSTSLQSTDFHACLLLNALLALVFHNLNLKIDIIAFPSGFPPEWKSSFKHLFSAVNLHAKVATELPSKSSNSRVIAFGSLFVSSFNGDLHRPSKKLNQFLGQLFLEGVLLKIENVVVPKWLKFEDLSSLEGKKKYWPLEVPSRPRSWHELHSNLLDPEIQKLLYTVEQMEISTEPHVKSGQITSVVAIDEASESFGKSLADILDLSFDAHGCGQRICLAINIDESHAYSTSEEALKFTRIINQKIHSGVKGVICIFSKPALAAETLIRSIAAENQEILLASVFLDGSNFNQEILLQALSLIQTTNNRFLMLSENKITTSKFVPISLESLQPFQKPPQFTKVLIIGGSGGIGTTVAEILDAKEVLFVSRTMHSLKHLYINSSAKIRFIQGDVSNFEFLKALFDAEVGIDCIVHCAGIVDNSMAKNLSYANFQSVAAAKIEATRNLLNFASKQKSMKKFIAMSSMAAIFGSFGQANYAWANAAMEALCLNSNNNFEKLVICWGPWKDAGMLAGTEAESIRNQIEAGGWKFIDKAVAKKVLKGIIGKSGKIAVFDGDFDVISDSRKELEPMIGHLKLKPNPTKKESPVKTRPLTKPSKEEIIEEIKNLACEVSGLSTISPEVGLMSVGLDSLMIEELREKIEAKFGVKILPPEMYENPTVKKLTETVLARLPKTIEEENEAVMRRIEATTPNEANSKLSKYTSKDVAIIGYSGTLPGCSTVESFWDAIFSSQELMTSFTDNVTAPGLKTIGQLPDISNFDPEFFNLSLKDAKNLDPQIRLLLQHAYLALEASGYYHLRSKCRIACYCSGEPSDYHLQNDRSSTDFLAAMYAKNQHSFGAAWVSHLLDLKGPTAIIYSACSSALVGIAQGMECLRAGKAEICLIGAANVITPGNEGLQGMALCKQDHCRPFDSQASGIIPASAAGVLILKLFDQAVKDNDAIHGIIKGAGVSNDGFEKSNFMAPGKGQTEALQEALLDAGLSPSDIDYIECHATGTSIGDRIEINSINEAYGEEWKHLHSLHGRKLVLGSVKANIGHSFAAAGMAGIFKCLGIFERDMVPGQINLKEECEELQKTPWLEVNQEPKTLKKEKIRMAVHAFGIGGTNACLILEKPSTSKLKVQNFDTLVANTAVILPISARSTNSCKQYASKLACHISKSGPQLQIIAETLQKHRPHFSCRAAVTSLTPEDASAQLSALPSNAISTGIYENLEPNNLGFFFAPQGVQYASMLTSLDFEAFPSMNKRFQELTAIASKEFLTDFAKIQAGPLEIEKPEYAQVALFISLIIIAEVLESIGIDPATVLGHSVGEYAALAFSKAISPEAGVKLLARRSILMAKTAPAKMVSFKAPENSVLRIPKEIEISAYLSSSIRVAVGPEDAMTAFMSRLKEAKIEMRQLKTSRGFHSSMMEPILPEFERLVSSFSFANPSRKVISNLHGKLITTELSTSQYFVDHLRNPVRIDKSLDTLLENKGLKVIVEIGPPGMLQNLLLQRGRSDIKVIRTLQTKDQAKNTPRKVPMILEVIAELWKYGAVINWEKLFGIHGKAGNLPGYVFEKVQCWNRKVLKPKLEDAISKKNDGDLKSQLLILWEECLATKKPITEESDFFSLGGNSLNGVQLCWRIEEALKIPVNISTLFDFPIFKDFLFQISQENYFQETSEITPVKDPEGQKFPLSLSQEQMYLLYHLEPGVHYNIVFSIKFTETHGSKFSKKAANQALMELIRRQGSLRSVFRCETNDVKDAYQMLKNENNFDLDWKRATKEEIREAIEFEKSFWFKIEESSFRLKGFEVIGSKAQSYVLIVSQHHIVTDGWSMTIFADEFSKLYQAYANHKQPSDDDLTKVQYVDYALHSRRSFDASKIASFALSLAEFTPSSLPTDFTPSMTRVFESDSLTFIIPSAAVEALRAQCQAHSTSFYTLLLLAFVRTVAKWTEHQATPDLMIGLASSGRLIPEAKNLIGYFLNNLIFALPDRQGLFAHDDLASALKYIKPQLAEAKSKEALPYHLVLSEWRKARQEAASDIFDIYFNYRHNLDFPKVDIPGMNTAVTQETNNRIFNLSVTIDEIGSDQQRLLLDYRRDRYAKDTIESFARDFMEEMKFISTGNLAQNSLKMSIAPAIEIPSRLKTTVVELVLEQCDKFPSRPAIEYPNGNVLSYEELKISILSKASAIQKAFGNLNHRSIGPSDVIPVILDYNDQVVWFLAVLAAGAAYCPLDAKNPSAYNEKLISLLDNCCFVISQVKLNTQHCLNPNEVLHSASELPISATSSSLMYVLFTSGSTGFPKGVQIEHRQVLNFLDTAREQLAITHDSRIAHSVNTIFDVSVFNIYAALTSGACLVQFPSVMSVIETSLQKYHLSHLFLTSAVFNALSSEEIEKFYIISKLKYLIIGGETPSKRNYELINRCKTFQLVQIYGPTEATVWATIDFVDKSLPPQNPAIIGKEIPDSEVLLVASGQALPRNSLAIGEVYLTGNIARGYLPSATEPERGKFKWLQDFETKAFATGDLARRLPNGKLEFLGRKSGFLKHNGMRIDPRMIEMEILKAAEGSVKLCVATVEEGKQRNYLVCYYCLIPKSAISLASIKQKLTHILPGSSVPDVFIKVPEIPINLSGKIDKIKLKEFFIGTSSFASAIDGVNQTPSKTGLKLAEIWKALLNLPSDSQLAREANFFLLGGNSLNLFTLKSQICSEFKVEISIDQLYRNPTFSVQENLIQRHLFKLKYASSENGVTAQISEIKASATSKPKANIYCIHAIGGTCYPFYSLAQVIQGDYAIYGIAFDLSYGVKSLKELAEFYKTQILLHTAESPFILMGHSLGGMLARLIAISLLDEGLITEDSVNVIMFDSWILGTDNLDLDHVRNYIEGQFKTIPDSQNFIEAAIYLSTLLKTHQFIFDSRVGIFSFKATDLTDTPLRRAILPTLTKDLVRSFIDNGWAEYAQDITTFLSPGDHDSLIRAENLLKVTDKLHYAIGNSIIKLTEF